MTRDARATLLHARVAAVASGTSTLEAALIGTPFAMVYRVAPLTWSLGRRLVKVDRFAMVNLIAERDVVPELVQTDFTPQRVCAELRGSFQTDEARQTMIAAFDEVRRRLRPSDPGGDCIRTGGPGRTFDCGVSQDVSSRQRHQRNFGAQKQRSDRSGECILESACSQRPRIKRREKNVSSVLLSSVSDIRRGIFPARFSISL